MIQKQVKPVVQSTRVTRSSPVKALVPENTPKRKGRPKKTKEQELGKQTQTAKQEEPGSRPVQKDTTKSSRKTDTKTAAATPATEKSDVAAKKSKETVRAAPKTPKAESKVAEAPPETATEVEKEAPKKRRGRPPKNKQPKPEADDDKAKEAQQSDEPLAKKNAPIQNSKPTQAHSESDMDAAANTPQSSEEPSSLKSGKTATKTDLKDSIVPLTPTSLKTQVSEDETPRSASDVVVIDTRGSVQLTNYLLGNLAKNRKRRDTSNSSSASAGASSNVIKMANTSAPNLSKPLDMSKIKSTSPEKRLIRVNVGLSPPAKPSSGTPTQEQCWVCKTPFASREDQMRHECDPDRKPNTKQLLFECDACGAMYMRQENLLKHKQVKHGVASQT